MDKYKSCDNLGVTRTENWLINIKELIRPIPRQFSFGCTGLFGKFQNLDISWVFGAPRLDTDKFGGGYSKSTFWSFWSSPKTDQHMWPNRESNPRRWYYMIISVTTNSERYQLIELYDMANFGNIYSWIVFSRATDSRFLHCLGYGLLKTVYTVQRMSALQEVATNSASLKIGVIVWKWWVTKLLIVIRTENRLFSFLSARQFSAALWYLMNQITCTQQVIRTKTLFAYGVLPVRSLLY